MPRKATGKRIELDAMVERRGWTRIGETECDQLRRELAPVSESYLRKLVRACGVELAPMVAGVRQEDFDSLEGSLLALLDEYESGDAARRAAVRKLVITAKDHARFAARQAADKRVQKTEMAMWMRTWLENPTIFREWVRLRRESMAKAIAETRLTPL